MKCLEIFEGTIKCDLVTEKEDFQLKRITDQRQAEHNSLVGSSLKAQKFC